MRAAVILLVAVGAAALFAAYQYNADIIRQQGFAFGNQLQQIQDDVKALQTSFYSSIEQHEEGDLTRDELLSRLEAHTVQFGELLARYDSLDPPEGFEGAVGLFRLSSQAQLESDVQYIEWIRTGDEAAKTRSDLQINESFELEIAALSEYNAARGP